MKFIYKRETCSFNAIFFWLAFVRLTYNIHSSVHVQSVEKVIPFTRWMSGFVDKK